MVRASVRCGECRVVCCSCMSSCVAWVALPRSSRSGGCSSPLRQRRGSSETNPQDKPTAPSEQQHDTNQQQTTTPKMAAAAASSSTPGVMAAVGQRHHTRQHGSSSSRASAACGAGDFEPTPPLPRVNGEGSDEAARCTRMRNLVKSSSSALRPRSRGSCALRCSRRSSSPLVCLVGGASIHAKDDEFPILCQTCLGENPLVRMVRCMRGAQALRP